MTKKIHERAATSTSAGEFQESEKLLMQERGKVLRGREQEPELRRRVLGLTRGPERLQTPPRT